MAPGRGGESNGEPRGRKRGPLNYGASDSTSRKQDDRRLTADRVVKLAWPSRDMHPLGHVHPREHPARHHIFFERCCRGVSESRSALLRAIRGQSRLSLLTQRAGEISPSAFPKLPRYSRPVIFAPMIAVESTDKEIHVSIPRGQRARSIAVRRLSRSTRCPPSSAPPIRHRILASQRGPPSPASP